MTNGASIRTTDYLDGFQYNQLLLEFFPHAEGYVKATNTGFTPGNPNYAFNYVYNYTDRLGNVRLSYAKDPQTGNLKILDESHYYPFGLKHQEYQASSFTTNPIQGIIIAPVANNPFKYKYNGKEFQDELGLNWTAMDFRNYDNALGRFQTPDILSELAPMYTPYRFAFNNPVYWRDPSGLFEENLAICPTCPKTPEFQPYIDDPNTFYIYDPETKTANELVELEQATVKGKKKEKKQSIDDILELPNNALGGFANGLTYIPNQGGYVYALRNKLAIRYTPKVWTTGNQFTFKPSSASKVLTKGTIVTSVLLETPEIINGFEESPEEGVKQTAGLAGGLAGAWAGGVLGAEFGATAGLLGGPFAEITVPAGALIFGVAGGILGGLWGEDAAEAMFESLKNVDLSPSSTLTPSEMNFNNATGGSKW